MITNREQFEINSITLDCQARISNGADIDDAFKWLDEEIEDIYKGIFHCDEEYEEHQNQEAEGEDEWKKNLKHKDSKKV